MGAETAGDHFGLLLRFLSSVAVSFLDSLVPIITAALLSVCGGRGNWVEYANEKRRSLKITKRQPTNPEHRKKTP